MARSSIPSIRFATAPASWPTSISPIYPGSDLALALGMMHVIIGEKLHDAEYVANYTNGFDASARLAREYPPERVEQLTGIAREDVVSLAREYATTRPAAIRLNYGVQRSERGGSATRAIAALPALIGSWREVGGGLQLSTSQAFRLEQDRPRNARIAAQIAARARRAHRQHDRTGQGAYSIDRSAREGDGGVQLQPRRHRAESEPGAGGHAARGSVHRGAGAVSERHRRSRRHPAAVHHVPGAHRPVPRLRALPFAARASRIARAGRNKIERGSLPAAGRAHGFRRRLFPRFGRRHDPHAARFRPSRSCRESLWNAWTASIPCD